jgi:dUTP pyrophosphatase
MIKLKVKDLRWLPTYQTERSAGADVYCPEGGAVWPGKVVLLKTGVWVNLEDRPNFYKVETNLPMLMLTLRSSLGKRGLFMPNGVGIIDQDYPGEILLMVSNCSQDVINIGAGERIGQLIGINTFRLWSAGVKQEARSGGFGSSGQK